MRISFGRIAVYLFSLTIIYLAGVYFGSFLHLLFFIFVVFGVFNVPLSLAGTFRDDFDSASLDTDRWEVTKAGKGGHSIKDGQLFLESPGVPDGVILYFKQKLEGDVTVE